MKNKKIFIIRPVRRTNDEINRAIEEFREEMYNEGVDVYDPLLCTDQTVNELEICLQNSNAIEACDEVWMWYDRGSTGSHFDIGVAFAARKPIYIINDVSDFVNSASKNFIKMIADYDRMLDGDLLSIYSSGEWIEGKEEPHVLQEAIDLFEDEVKRLQAKQNEEELLRKEATDQLKSMLDENNIVEEVYDRLFDDERVDINIYIKPFKTAEHIVVDFSVAQPEESESIINRCRIEPRLSWDFVSKIKENIDE